MRDIEELRKDIDGIDRELVKLFEKRMKVVEEVATYKIATGKALKDPQREAALIEKNVALLEDSRFERLLSVFFKDIMEYSRTHQQTLMTAVEDQAHDLKKNPIVGYQGINGSFSSIAVKKFFKESYSTQSFTTFEETFDSLYNNQVDYIVLPIENSSTGAINEVYDLLLKYEMQIIGDVYLNVRHNLIGQGSIDKIQAVYSHEQGFKQSRKFLSDFDWQHFSYSNTAESVKHVKALNDETLAAIASVEAAEAYGLDVLVENIQDHDYNTTRFVVLSKKALNDDLSNKISMVIRLSHEPRSLFNVLELIAKSNINMLKIESRPIPDKPWAYMFYIDIAGNINDEKTKETLEQVRQACHSVLILGNYYSRNGVSQ
ncbi:chorismate mutase [Acidaminobacter sp. JC074]|uniref:chorismate mutase n=1 Tax=Acidaminobacter sp. JC074 TaxID=2530199 RepID=UPI001F0FA504|nr:chorismate mutase [Acidaminobacter sp. JC074]MCH4887336.1 chorismate mutase [Acidaminobacter sp. JC074]